MNRVLHLVFHENVLLGIGLILPFLTPALFLINLNYYNENIFANLSFFLISIALMVKTYKEISGIYNKKKKKKM